VHEAKRNAPSPPKNIYQIAFSAGNKNNHYKELSYLKKIIICSTSINNGFKPFISRKHPFKRFGRQSSKVNHISRERFMRILLAEDDEVIIGVLEKALTRQHYSVHTATNGQMGWELVATYRYDLIILDIGLPKLNGIEFCQRLRAHHYLVPVLLLTAQNSSDDKILGLDAGADDYVVKPFELLELLARIRVLLRRGSLPQITVLEWGNLRLDPGVRIATYNGQALTLTPKEYRLLELFLRNPQRVFSRNDVLNHLWSSEASPGEDTVTVHIKDLRCKLKRASAPSDVIETVYGHGYRLKVEATKAPAEKDLIRQKTQAGLAVVWQKYLG
jgi:DNA-binding response OmpR family regulator